MSINLVTPASDTPITLAEAKLHLREYSSDFDNDVLACLKAAVSWAENFTGRAIMTQTWDLRLDEFPSSGIVVPKPPLQSASVFYVLEDGTEEELSTDLYNVDKYSSPGWIVPVSLWPATLSTINAVRVRFVAGYASADDVPLDLIAAIKLVMGTLYANKESVVVGVIPTNLPLSAEYLARNYRIERGFA